MPTLASLLAFLAVSAVIVAIPGPSVFFTIGRALAHGRREALLTVLGNGLGLAVQAGLVAVGLAPVLQASGWLLTAVRLLGGAYLIWLGAQAIRSAVVARVRDDSSVASRDSTLASRDSTSTRDSALARRDSTVASRDSTSTHDSTFVGDDSPGLDPQPESSTAPEAHSLRACLLVGATNPKSLVFLAALLPQFINHQAPAAPQLFGMGVLFAILAILGDSIWALAAAQARAWLTSSPSRLARVRITGGAIQIGLGLWTLVGAGEQ